MSEFEQTPNDVNTTPAGNMPVLEKHHHLIAILLLVTAVFLAGVFFFVSFQEGKNSNEDLSLLGQEGLSTGCNYASNQEAHIQAVNGLDTQVCDCVTNDEEKASCQKSVEEELALQNAKSGFDVAACENIETEVKKQLCIQTIESGIEYLKENDPGYLAKGYIISQNYDKAIEVFEEAIAAGTNDARTLAQFALTLALSSAIEEGRYDEEKLKRAVSLLEEAKSKDPNEAEVYRVEGSLYTSYLPDYEKAITSYTTSIQFDSENIDSYIGRGQAYMLAENNEQAVADFEKAAQLDTDKKNTQVYYSLCLLYGSGSVANKEKATSNCTTALSLEKNPAIIEEIQKNMAKTE